MDFLIRFSQSHEPFRIPEIESIAKLENIDIKIIDYNPGTPFCIVRLADPGSAPRLVRRSILTQSIAELWGHAASLPALHATLAANPTHSDPLYRTCSWKIHIDSFRATRTQDDTLAVINSFAPHLRLPGPIALRGPDETLVLFEEWPDRSPKQGERRGAPGAEAYRLKGEPARVYFGRRVGVGARDLPGAYDLKRRRYISTTSMDAELALITANMALAAPGKLMYDPFVGTGSFPVACAHFGALVFGSDIDGRTIRGKVAPEKKEEEKQKDGEEEKDRKVMMVGVEEKEENEQAGKSKAEIKRMKNAERKKTTAEKNGPGTGTCLRDNFVQYGLLNQLGDVFAADLTNSPVRGPGRGPRFLDGIMCDPPYGVREGLRVLGHRDPQGSPWVLSTAEALYKDPCYIPSKKPYSFLAMLDDLLVFASATLVDDGRLSFWMPTANEESREVAVPEHPCLEVVSVCAQVFSNWSRKLITYRRRRDSEVNGEELRKYVPRASEAGRSADELNAFRQGYFSKFTNKV